MSGKCTANCPRHCPILGGGNPQPAEQVIGTAKVVRGRYHKHTCISIGEILLGDGFVPGDTIEIIVRKREGK